MKVDQAVVTGACKGLLEFVKQRNQEQNKNQLFDENTETALLKFSLTEIPAKAVHKPQRITLPHPFYTSSDVCVFVRDDLEDREKKFHEKKRKLWKNMIKEENVEAVKKVISVDKLKKEFKQFQDKRELARSYDLFLCDKSIIEIMPRELGKTFYKHANKKPWPVVIEKKDPVGGIKAALNCTTLNIPNGPDMAIKIGRCNMKAEELAENCNAVIKVAQPYLKKFNLSVKSACVSATDCISLPVYERELKEDEFVVVGKEFAKSGTAGEKSNKRTRTSATTAAESSDEEKETIAAEMEKKAAGRKGGKKSAEKESMPLLKKRKNMAMKKASA